MCLVLSRGIEVEGNVFTSGPRQPNIRCEFLQNLCLLSLAPPPRWLKSLSHCLKESCQAWLDFIVVFDAAVSLFVLFPNYRNLLLDFNKDFLLTYSGCESLHELWIILTVILSIDLYNVCPIYWKLFPWLLELEVGPCCVLQSDWGGNQKEVEPCHLMLLLWTVSC